MVIWKDQGYNCYTLNVGIVTISVYWEMVPRDQPTGYKYSYGPYTSKQLYPDLASAQNAAIISLRKRLQDALQLLAPEESGTQP